MSLPVPYVPERGHLVWIDFDPPIGHEQAGHRPALVLSNAGYNSATGLAIVCPVTSQKKSYPFEVQLPPGLVVVGVVLCDHIKNVDWQARGVTYAGDAPTAVITAVLSNVLRAVS
jgi:mRNA interferase MazF